MSVAVTGGEELLAKATVAMIEGVIANIPIDQAGRIRSVAPLRLCEPHPTLKQTQQACGEDLWELDAHVAPIQRARAQGDAPVAPDGAINNSKT
jgi:hypothetical protein